MNHHLWAPPWWRRHTAQRTGQTRSVAVATHAALSVLVVTLLLAACAPADPSVAATATALQCQTTFQCRVVVPLCGPADTSPPIEHDLLYGSIYVPQNVAALVGFQPLVPTVIPSRAGWYRVRLWQHISLPGGAPWFYGSYGAWPPVENGSLTGTSMLSVMTIDETTGTLGPLTNLSGAGQAPRIVSQRTVAVGTSPAILYHLERAVSPEITAEAIELLWHAGPVALRLIVVPSFQSFIVYDPQFPSGELDAINPWDGGDAPSDAVIEQVADSVAPYVGCHT